MNPHLHWLLSFYRHSEITGALFFGRLAQYLPNEKLRLNLTRHFADEAQHARYWSECLDVLGAAPLKLDGSYQDRYFEAMGIPANIMEILAITKVFEGRVINQYHQHRELALMPAPVVDTFDRIMRDEVWHLQWVGEALDALKPKFGAEHVRATLKRYREIDNAIYNDALAEYSDRIVGLGGSAAYPEEATE